MSLRVEFYYGIVLPDPDPLNLGRYKVHVEELHLYLPNTDGHWCSNKIHSYRVGYDITGNNYGEYKPLQPGTNVLVSVSNGEWNSSSIVQILSDDSTVLHPNVMPFGITDRDDFYLLIRTAKYDSIISISEDTVDEPPRTLHVYHNGSTIILDSDGIHINVKNQNVSVGGASNINISGDCNLQVGGQTNIKSVGNVNIDSNGKIFLNSGHSVGNSGYSTTPTTKELIKR